jgi:hypothetical protein
MKGFSISRLMLSSCLSVYVLAAYGGSQPPIGAPGTMPQTFAFATQADRGRSWMSPNAKRKDLLYVADSQNSNARVYSYPQGALVGTLSGIYGAWAACADKEGDVFISTLGYNPEILEYKHGGKKPIAVLQDGDSAYFPSDCSVDPSTGNLAVANAQGYYGESSGNVAIYAGAQGSPTFISDNRIPYPSSCAYDDKGNLYIGGKDDYGRFKFAGIKRGKENFKSFRLKTKLCCVPGPFVWNNDRLDVAAGLTIYEFKAKGRSGRETMTVEISTPGVNWMTINRGTLVGSGYDRAAVYLWRYPSGGNPYETITQGLNMPEGVAISPAR